MKTPLTISRRSFTALAATAALTLPLGLSGCGGGDGAGGGDSDAQFEFAATRTFMVGSFDGKRMLVINGTVKNKSDIPMPAGIVGSGYASATQDGTPLATGYIDVDSPDALPRSADIAAGGEGQAQLVFELAKTEGSVEVIVSTETLDYSRTVEVYKETFDLSKVELVESEATFEATVDNVKVTDDGEGKDLLVLAMTFTNLADSPTSFLSAVSMDLFQNDTQLKWGFLPYNHPALDQEANTNATTEVRNGASLPVQQVFELLDTTAPVDIKLIDSASYDKRVVFEKRIEVAGAAGGTSV